jgi:Tol biopolymer transport system component
MLGKRGILICSVAMVFATAFAADLGNLIVDNSGRLLLISNDGASRTLVDSMISAAMSPDGRTVAFTSYENPKALLDSSQILSVMSTSGGASRRILQLPNGAHFGSIGWLPDGRAILFEGKEGHLFLATVSSEPALRDLGPWYQGFSVSPDGSHIVHAVNSPATGLEVLDIQSGQRSLIHRTPRVVWDAKFSPDGQWIAYQMTFRDPPKTKDDEPNCAPPSIELRIYSLRTHMDSAVKITGPKEWDNVKSFAWSPDGKRLALTAGTTDCDYPGSANGVFITTLDLKSQTRVSTGAMSFEPVFSTDSRSVAYVDFEESPARLLRYEIATRVRTLIRRATDFDNYFNLLDWK